MSFCASMRVLAVIVNLSSRRGKTDPAGESASRAVLRRRPSALVDRERTIGPIIGRDKFGCVRIGGRFSVEGIRPRPSSSSAGSGRNERRPPRLDFHLSIVSPRRRDSAGHGTHQTIGGVCMPLRHVPANVSATRTCVVFT